jgi:hypothetical protein
VGFLLFGRRYAILGWFGKEENGTTIGSPPINNGLYFLGGIS